MRTQLSPGLRLLLFGKEIRDVVNNQRDVALVDPGRFGFWQLVSYMFLHAGFGCIFFNLLALWMPGKYIDSYWGTRRFAVYYFLTRYPVGFGMFQERPIMLIFPPTPVEAKYFVAIFGIIELKNDVLGTLTH